MNNVVNRNLTALAVGMMVSAGLASAQTPAAAPTKVAVIQIQSALAATKEGQKAAAEMETKFAPRKKELDGKQADLKDMQDQLQRGGNTLADARKEELMRSIDAKTKTYNRDVQDAEAELQEEQQKIVSVLGQKMMQVVDKYAQANGFAIVLDVSSQNTPVLYASNSVDITKEIVDLYDKTNFAASPAPAAAAPRPAPAAPRPAATPAPAPAKKP